MQQKLRQYIARGETKKAIEYLQKNTSDADVQTEVTLLSARYEAYTKDKRLGTTSSEQQSLTINQINYSLLTLISQISDETVPQSTDNQVSNKKKNWWTYITIALIIIIILVGIVKITGCNLQSIFGATTAVDNTKDLVIYVHGSGGKQNYVLENEGELLVDLGGDRRDSKIGEKGRTVLSEIPAKFMGKVLNISVKAAGWAAKKPEATYLWKGEPIYFPIQRDRKLLTIKGRVVDADSKKGLAETTIMIDNQWQIMTDSVGRFHYELTEKDYQEKYSLSFQKLGYQEVNEFYHPTSSSEFRLKRILKNNRSISKKKEDNNYTSAQNFGVFAGKLQLKSYKFGRDTYADDFNANLEFGYYDTDSSTINKIPQISSSIYLVYHSEIPPEPTQFSLYHNLKPNRHSKLLNGSSTPIEVILKRIGRNMYGISTVTSMKAGTYSLFDQKSSTGYLFKVK